MKYEFTTDWFSSNIPNWEVYVKPYLKSLIKPKILEIGAFEGRSTLWFLNEIPNSLITVIDNWDGEFNGAYDRFIFNTREFKQRIELIRDSSEKMKFLDSNAYDAIYIDGDHRSEIVIRDLIFSVNLLKSNGILILDDYLGGDLSKKYPKPAIDFFDVLYKDEKYNKLFDGYQQIYQKI